MLNETLVEYILLACVLLAIFLPSLSGRIAMPVLQVLARWIRWFLFAALFAFVLHLTEWSTRRTGYRRFRWTAVVPARDWL